MEEEPEIAEDITYTNTDEDDLSGLPFLDEGIESSTELTEDDLDFIDNNSTAIDDSSDEITEESLIGENQYEKGFTYMNEEQPVVPVYPVEDGTNAAEEGAYAQGDTITHPRYGRGVVEKIIKYGNKTLCSINFDNVGRRLLDPSISDLTKLA